MDENTEAKINNCGKKFTILLVMLLVLSIPIAFLFGIVDDRVAYKGEAVDSVRTSWAGQQLIKSPTLSIKEPNKKENTSLKLADYKVDIKVKNEYRKKGIYNVPVYTADVELKGDFLSNGSIKNLPANFKIEVSDARGFLSAPKIKLMGNSLNASDSTDISTKLTTASNKIPFEVKYQIRGIEQLNVATDGVSNEININGNWANPSFEGNFLPVKKEINADSFSAQWKVPKIATTTITAPMAGVSFLNPVDNYRMATRAVKYAFLFLVLSFMTYFIFEITSKKETPIHYLQYLMMGVAMLIFYLLLVSISEFMPFQWAYLVASGMTVGLIGSYTHFVLTKQKNKAFSLFVVGILSLLYAFLFILLLLQDFSLIIGSLGLFLIMALVMYATRNVDWFGNN